MVVSRSGRGVPVPWGKSFTQRLPGLQRLHLRLRTDRYVMTLVRYDTTNWPHIVGMEQIFTVSSLKPVEVHWLSPNGCSHPLAACVSLQVRESRTP